MANRFTPSVGGAEPLAAPVEQDLLRVVIADDSYLVREALGHLLETDPRVELVARCQDGTELAETVDAELPDVVVTDIRMPPSGDDEGIVFANRLRETHPEIGVVVVSQYADPRYGLALLERRLGSPRLPAQGPRARPRAPDRRRVCGRRAAARWSTPRWSRP